MTVKTLIEKLKEFPEHFEVMMYEEGGVFTHNPVEYVVKEKIPMRDGEGGTVLSKETVVTLKS